MLARTLLFFLLLKTTSSNCPCLRIKTSSRSCDRPCLKPFTKLSLLTIILHARRLPPQAADRACVKASPELSPIISDDFHAMLCTLVSSVISSACRKPSLREDFLEAYCRLQHHSLPPDDDDEGP